MTENFESDAHDYLLHQMEATRRAAFEEELQRNPEARAALKTQADSLAGFAFEVTGAEPLGAADHRAALGAIVAATRSPQRSPLAGAGSQFAWSRLLWPVAAVLLVVLNLFEFERPLDLGFGRNPGLSPDRKSRLTENAETRGDAAGPASPVGPTTPRISSSSPASTRPDPGLPLENPAQELERLQEDVAELRRVQRELQTEYDSMIQRVAQRAAVDKELNRLSTMELVDAASYARGDRKGLVNVGLGILTEPGVVVATDTTPPPSASGSSIPTPKPTYAWSVFDEKEHRGYLNLYNLPTLSGDQTMQIWARPAGAGDFQRVGEVPSQFQGGNGSVQYALPGATSAPAEILITIEPRGVPPTVPAGPMVLKGP